MRTLRATTVVLSFPTAVLTNATVTWDTQSFGPVPIGFIMENEEAQEYVAGFEPAKLKARGAGEPMSAWFLGKTAALSPPTRPLSRTTNRKFWANCLADKVLGHSQSFCENSVLFLTQITFVWRETEGEATLANDELEEELRRLKQQLSRETELRAKEAKEFADRLQEVCISDVPSHRSAVYL